MASEFVRFVSSDVVELLAQRGESRFLVHKDILTAQSKPFRDALTGEWKEATERKVDLGDWDSDTVGRMVEFLYRGRYRYPDPEPLSPEHSTPVQETEVVVQGTNISSQSFISCPLTPVNQCLRQFLSAPERNDETAVERLARFNPAQYDYGEALLAHAKVYHLAHYKAIYPLRTIALQHLLDTLARIDPVVGGFHNVEGIVDLVRYVYENTDHLQNHQEPLRRLVSHFVASNFIALKLSPDVVQLLSEGGGIVMDVMENIYRQVPRPSMRSDSGNRPPTLYVSKLCVVTGTSPRDHLQELNGTDARIWSGAGSNPVWLYLEYTPVADEACTRITILFGMASTPPDSVRLGIGRHLSWKIEPGVKQKITAVSLLRHGHPIPGTGTIHADHGVFNGITADINMNWYSDYLYIVWKSVQVT